MWCRMSVFLFQFLFFSSSLFLNQFTDIFKENTLEVFFINGLVFSILTCQQIISITSKVNNLLTKF